MALTRCFVLALSLGLGLSTVACAAPEEEADGAGAAASVGADIPTSEALLARAVKMAESYNDQRKCDDLGDDGSVSKGNIVAFLRKAIAVRDTVFFRTEVIAKKPALAKALKGTLEWQEVSAAYRPTDPKTLTNALGSEVTFWGTGDIHEKWLTLRDGVKISGGGVRGAATYLDAADDPNEKSSTFTLDASGTKLTLDSGEEFTLKHTGEFLTLGDEAFTSMEFECEGH